MRQDILSKKKCLEGMTFGNYPFFKSVGYSVFISVASVFRILLFCSMSAQLMAKRSVGILIDRMEHGGEAIYKSVPYALSRRESTRRIDE